MSNRTHWWDYYYVRYFVGAIFGAALLLWLQTHAHICAGNQCKIGAGSAAVEASALGAIGLAFCYLASAPILVLHALRFQWRNQGFALRTSFDRIGCAVAVGVLGGLVLWAGLYVGLSYGVVVQQLIPAVLWIAYVPFVLVVLSQVFLLCKFRMNAIAEGYRWLAIARARDKTKLYGKQKSEYIESYRHLREHGNAYAILFAEIVLALALDVSPSWFFVGGLLVLWILPAAFVWFIATQLEFQIDHL